MGRVSGWKEAMAAACSVAPAAEEVMRRAGVERAGPYYNQPFDERKGWIVGVPRSEGVYVIYDGFWERRVRWTGRHWRALRGWPWIWPEPVLWKFVDCGRR